MLSDPKQWIAQTVQHVRACDPTAMVAHIKLLINGYQKAKSERDALVAALTRYVQMWPADDERTRDVSKLLFKLKSGELAGAKTFSEPDAE